MPDSSANMGTRCTVRFLTKPLAIYPPRQMAGMAYGDSGRLWRRTMLPGCLYEESNTWLVPPQAAVVLRWSSSVKISFAKSPREYGVPHLTYYGRPRKKRRLGHRQSPYWTLNSVK